MIAAVRRRRPRVALLFEGDSSGAFSSFTDDVELFLSRSILEKFAPERRRQRHHFLDG